MLTRVETFFSRDVADFRARLSQLDASLDTSLPATRNQTYRDLAEAMHAIEAACRRLESTIGANPDLLAETQQRFQAETAEFFDKSWIGSRARTKPRGYPGDYLLLNTIYDEQPKSPGLGGYIDLYIMDMVLAHSVRARWQAIRQFLSDELARRRENVSILNVACGPCREYVAGINDVGASNVRITCLDNDPEALDFVQTKIAPTAPGISELKCTRYNALRMKSADATIRNFGRSDIIYSIGLCDYIEDRYMIEMLAGWRESLSDDGVLFVAFKDARRYDKTPYQWLLDWHFYQRTEEDCRRLFEQAGFNMDGLETTRDATGVIINFVSRTRVATPVRVDTAETIGAPHITPAGERAQRDAGVATNSTSSETP